MAEPDLCRDEKVMSYPTLPWYVKGYMGYMD
jgi:hypothetical protein